MRPTPSGRQPHSRAVVGASIPVRDNGYAPAGASKDFPLTLWKLSDAEAGERPMERPFPKCSPFFTIVPGKNFLDVSIFRPQSETPLQESPPFPPHTQPFVFPLHEPQKLFIINPF